MEDAHRSRVARARLLRKAPTVVMRLQAGPRRTDEPARCGHLSSPARTRSTMQEQRSAPRHFSMVREFHLADFFTLGNAGCGVGAILLAMLFMASGERAHFFAAALLAPI